MEIDESVKKIPKAELHVHIEGTVTPQMAKTLAGRHGMILPEDIFSDDGQSFVWNDFLDCVTRVYGAAADTIRTAQDYEDVVYDYLKRSADEGCIYTELIAYPAHVRHLKEKFPDNDLTYQGMIDGIVRGIDRAHNEAGIDARINVTFVRHDSEEMNRQAIDDVCAYPHSYIVGLDLAGGEQEGDIADYKDLFDEIQARFGRKLGVRAHAGEAAGPQNVHDAMDILNVSRIGHGIRANEDVNAVKKLVGRNVVLEVCPTSNILLVKETPDFASHPLRKLKGQGVKITLNSDDPGLFGNSIGTEYQIAKDEFGFTHSELVEATKTAIEASFADPKLKSALSQEVDDYCFFFETKSG